MALALGLRLAACGAAAWIANEYTAKLDIYQWAADKVKRWSRDSANRQAGDVSVADEHRRASADLAATVAVKADCTPEPSPAPSSSVGRDPVDGADHAVKGDQTAEMLWEQADEHRRASADLAATVAVKAECTPESSPAPSSSVGRDPVDGADHAVKGDQTAEILWEQANELRHASADLVATVVKAESTPESSPAPPSSVGRDLVDGADHVVKGDQAAETLREHVDELLPAAPALASGPRPRDERQPALGEPPDTRPATSILGAGFKAARAAFNAARAWAQGLFQRVTGWAGRLASDPIPVVGMLDPKASRIVWRIAWKMMLLGLETAVLEHLNNNKVLRKIYNILKSELYTLF